jgi:glycosyltransferase involved in cell wall biosynthesis
MSGGRRSSAADPFFREGQDLGVGGETTSSERRRLLFLTPFSPRLDATHGGGRSIAQLISRLAQRHDVALLAIRGDDDPPVDEALRTGCVLVDEFVRRGVGRTLRDRWSRRARLLSALAVGRPMWVADNHLTSFAVRARQVAESWRPDVVQFEFHVMGQYASAVRGAGAPVVLTQHESGAAAARDVRSVQRHAAPVFLLDEFAWRRYERHLLTVVDAFVTFTERDRQELLDLRPNASVVRIPLATEIPPRPLSAAGAEEPSIVFIGSFMHPPNVDAATRLVCDIFPLVEHDHPTARLYVVGEDPAHKLARYARERVVVTGRVPEVTPYLDAATVVAVPIRLGGGIRVKVLEALAAGKAIVASSRALEGLDVVDGVHVLVADTDLECAEAIARLLSDRDLRVELAGRAREWASSNISWERSVEAYEALYDSLLQVPQQARAQAPR